MNDKSSNKLLQLNLNKLYLHEISLNKFNKIYLMTEISYNIWISTSDSDLIESLGAFIRHHRLLQNKSQSQLAKEAGIVRSTLSLFERGENTSMMVFIQLLRALNLLHFLQDFRVKELDTDIEYSNQEPVIRGRARRNHNVESKPKADWYFY